ncbi:ArsR/SmtB family transcription factor [Dinoroseobacter sp. S124A]|uniref:ArsR/SmtB family transcription factor n=1 Tax=Dinoroseobacter sp. S124A TaxID=3415128 RepID=UPI003C79B7DC
MDIDAALAALNNPTRRKILEWLKDRDNFPPALPEHAELEGVCVAYIQDKAQLSQSTISTYMAALRKAGFVTSERHGQWTFYRRDEAVIAAFLSAFDGELRNP